MCRVFTEHRAHSISHPCNLSLEQFWEMHWNMNEAVGVRASRSCSCVIKAHQISTFEDGIQSSETLRSMQTSETSQVGKNTGNWCGKCGRKTDTLDLSCMRLFKGHSPLMSTVFCRFHPATCCYVETTHKSYVPKHSFILVQKKTIILFGKLGSLIHWSY